jgi:hypothetical protein
MADFGIFSGPAAAAGASGAAAAGTTAATATTIGTTAGLTSAAAGTAATGATIGGTASLVSTAGGFGATAGSVGTTLGAIANYASIASSLAGVGLGVLSSNRQATGQRNQAGDARAAAEREQLRGRVQSLNLRAQLARTLASQNARYAAAGLTLEGTPENVAEQTQLQAEREFSVQDLNTATRTADNLNRANLLDDSADVTEATGYATAGVNLFGAADRFAQRQPGTVRGGR